MDKQMKVWVAEIYTEAADTYVYLFEKEPNRDYIVERVWEQEGRIEDYSFYNETLSIRIYEREVE